MQKENDDLKQNMDLIQNENQRLRDTVNALQSNKNEENMEELRKSVNVLENENVELNETLKALTISKINMIQECNEQLNLLRKGIIIYQKKNGNQKWLNLPFSVDIKWDNE